MKDVFDKNKSELNKITFTEEFSLHKDDRISTQSIGKGYNYSSVNFNDNSFSNIINMYNSTPINLTDKNINFEQMKLEYEILKCNFENCVAQKQNLIKLNEFKQQNLNSLKLISNSSLVNGNNEINSYSQVSNGSINQNQSKEITNGSKVFKRTKNKNNEQDASNGLKSFQMHNKTDYLENAESKEVIYNQKAVSPKSSATSKFKQNKKPDSNLNENDQILELKKQLTENDVNFKLELENLEKKLTEENNKALSECILNFDNTFEELQNENNQILSALQDELNYLDNDDYQKELELEEKEINEIFYLEVKTLCSILSEKKVSLENILFKQTISKSNFNSIDYNNSSNLFNKPNILLDKNTIQSNTKYDIIKNYNSSFNNNLTFNNSIYTLNKNVRKNSANFNHQQPQNSQNKKSMVNLINEDEFVDKKNSKIVLNNNINNCLNTITNTNEHINKIKINTLEINSTYSGNPSNRPFFSSNRTIESTLNNLNSGDGGLSKNGSLLNITNNVNKIKISSTVKAKEEKEKKKLILQTNLEYSQKNQPFTPLDVFFYFRIMYQIQRWLKHKI